MAQRVTDLRHGGEQRVRRFDQRIEAAEARQVGGGSRALQRRRVLAALAARRGQNTVGSLGRSSSQQGPCVPAQRLFAIGTSSPSTRAALYHLSDSA